MEVKYFECLSFFMLGVVLVQIRYQNMETMDSIDDYEPKTGIG